MWNVIIGPLAGAAAAFAVNWIWTCVQNQRKKRHTLLMLCGELVRAYKRVVQLYLHYYPREGEPLYTKATIFELVDYRGISELLPLTNNKELFDAVAYLRNQYFLVKGQLDKGAELASQIDSTELFDDLTKIRHVVQTDSYQGSAWAFISNAPASLANDRNDDEFERLTASTETVLKVTKAEFLGEPWRMKPSLEDVSLFELDLLETEFYTAKREKKEHDEFLKKNPNIFQQRRLFLKLRTGLEIPENAEELTSPQTKNKE